MWTGGKGVGSAGVLDGDSEGVRCAVVGSSRVGRAGDDVTTELLSICAAIDVITERDEYYYNSKFSSLNYYVH